jgi:thymidylate kinase
MHDEDREIRTLRYALKQQQHSGDTINLMGEDVEGEDLDLELLTSLSFMSPDWEEADEADLDQELLASLMVKRSAEDGPHFQRAPAKRAAFGPPLPSAANASNAAAAAERTDPYRRVPRQRQPFDVAPYPAGPNRHASAAALGPRPATPTAHRQPDAGQLVADKAKKMAADICRSIKFDGMQEATLSPQAVLTCLAGHLAGDQSLTALGQNMARRVDAVLQGMRRATPAPAVLNTATATAHPSTALRSAPVLSRNTPGLLSRHPLRVLPKISTCKIMARINGREVDCVVDTGASTSAITLDCLRRLDSLIDTTKTSYLNADGRITAGKGKVPNLVLSMGEFETLINPTVTSALNYNVLIGNDVLTRARAFIDYNQGKMVIQVDPTFSQEMDLQLLNPEEFYHAAAPLQAADSNIPESQSDHDTALMMEDLATASPLPTKCKTPNASSILSAESHRPPSPISEDGEVSSALPPVSHSSSWSLDERMARQLLVLEDSKREYQRLCDQLMGIMARDRNDPAEAEHQLKLRTDLLAPIMAAQEQVMVQEEKYYALLEEDALTYFTNLPEGDCLLNHPPGSNLLLAYPPEDDLLFFAEVLSTDGADAFTPELSDEEEMPGLISDSEDEPSSDPEDEFELPRPHHRPFEPQLPEIAVYAEAPAQHTPQQDGFGESFPDDDALADHRDLSMASMIDRTNVTDAQFEEALQLLEDNRDCFCFHPSELGTCTIGAHTIDTGDAAPIKRPYYRMPFKKYEQLKAHVDRLLENKIIRPSNSAWAAPMHLVPKKGDDTREVVDYRALNAVTKADAFPIPRIDDILYNIGPADTFSVLDCFSGYLQCKMEGAPDDPSDTSTTSPSIERSAFSVPWGHYEYIRLPFGLQGGPATFMRIQHEVLKGLVGKKAFGFFDDTITYSTGFDKHKENLIEIFGRLREAVLKLNPVKCQFFKDHVTFLGFVVDEKGLSPDPRLIEAIAHRLEPNNPKAVASFLGLTGYYRRFVKDYSKIAEPLTRLLSPKVKFSWGTEQQLAFDTLKDKLTSYPVLRRPDFSKPFILHTDASGQAIGAILAQKDENGKEHAVAFHSKKLTPAERNWPITHLECFAVVNAVCDHFADFLLGHQFTVYTDCAALQWLLKSQKLQGKLARWSLRLQEFMPFEIQYRKGSQHQAADAMTRHADFYPTSDQTTTATEEILTLQEPAATPLQPPAASTTPTPEAKPTHSPGSVQSQHSLSPESLDEAIKAAVRICIEGNIGCGKTTAVEALQELQATNPDWQKYTIISEPVQEWHHLLGPLYSAPSHSPAKHHMAALLQVAVLNAYALRVPSPVSAPTVISERSPWSSLAVFLPTQSLPPTYEAVVTHTAHHLYANLDNAMPTAVIYIKTDPATCINRIQQRQRQGENMLSLDYITKLHEQYEQEMAQFPGPVITVDGTKPKEAVALAVQRAVNLLMGASILPGPRSYNPIRHMATTPFHVHDFPMLRRLFPDCSLTTCDPYLLNMFPEQILTHEEVSPRTGGKSSSPPLQPAAAEAAVQYKPYTFEATPAEFMYDKDYEVLVLFQNGPGTFAFSPQFCAEYEKRYYTPINHGHRIDNTQALQLYAELGPWLSNGPNANIQVAAVPKKAAGAILVLQIHEDGTEVVFVNTNKYAELKGAAMTQSQHSFWCNTDDGFPWQEAFRNEAYTLDGWVRLVRLRPMLPCGLSLANPRPSTLLHSSTPPSEGEYSPHQGEGKLRLAGGLPHHSEGLQIKTTALDQINVKHDTPGKTKRASAEKALQHIHTWTNAQAQAVTNSQEVPSDLPCENCGSPNDWTHMLICSSCDRGFHTYCIGLDEVPNTDEWLCDECCTPKVHWIKTGHPNPCNPHQGLTQWFMPASALLVSPPQASTRARSSRSL